MGNFDNIIYTINNMSCWVVMLIFILTLTALVYLYREFIKMQALKDESSKTNSDGSKKEGFTSSQELIMDEDSAGYLSKSGKDKYDKFYVEMYDKLFYDKLTNDYEVGVIINKCDPTIESDVLVIGSKTGSVVNTLANKGFNAYGLEESPTMLQYSMNKYPDDRFVLGSGSNSILFNPEKFTLIACLDFSIYSVKNRMALFDNCYRWLMPGGYLAIHLINPSSYFKEKRVITNINRTIPITKLFFNASSSKNSIDITEISLKEYNYKSTVQILPDNRIVQRETFINKKNKKVRQNINNIKIDEPQVILSEAKDAGFNMLSQTELTYVSKSHQYIYILYKPSL